MACARSSPRPARVRAKTGNRLTIIVVETGEIRRRVMGGEAFDVVMVPRETSDEFEKAGKIVPGSAVSLIRVSFGIAVPTDGPRPDITTPDGAQAHAARRPDRVDHRSGDRRHQRRAFHGRHQQARHRREMKDKIVPNPGGSFHAKRVVQGEADLSFQAEHEIRCVKGATFLPLPPVFQRTIIFMGGVSIDAKNATRRQRLSIVHDGQ